MIDISVNGAPAGLLRFLLGYKGEKKVFEFLIDGPRGTGKTLGIGWDFRVLAQVYPGIRMRFVRKTRRSITQSFCPDFESIVLAHDPDVKSGAGANNRTEYVFKRNGGSILALAGFDDPLKDYSANWDLIVIEEAAQFTEKEIDEFHGGLRQWTPGMQFQALILLTNPKGPRSWMLNRWKRKKCIRYQSHHKDNPKWWNGTDWTPEGRAYCAPGGTLDKMPEPQRSRNYLGIWKSSEGAVWDFDDEKHITSVRSPKVRWRAAAMDWGYTEPCSLMVGEKDESSCITVVREVYRQKMPIDWWAQEVVSAKRDLDIQAIWVDPSRPEIIDYFNRRMRETFPALGSIPFARGANNKRASSPGGDMGGLDLVRHYLESGKLKFWDGRLRHHPDPELADASQPCSFVDEVGEYVFWTPKGSEDDQSESRDHTDESCVDHACDDVRYLVTGMHTFDLSAAGENTFGMSPEQVQIMKAMGRWPPMS